MDRSSQSDSRLRWQARVDAQLTSGLTIAQFCQQHSYSTASFYQWKRKLAASNTQGNTLSPLTAKRSQPTGYPFQQVVPKRPSTTVACVELSLPGGVVARVPADQLDALELVLRLAAPATA